MSRVTRDRMLDLAVIGAGTAGLVAAQVAAAAGARVALVEAERTGGDCLWTGCVPSKALLAAAAAAQGMRDAHRFGLPPAHPEVDRGRVADHVHDSRQRIAPQDSPERLRAMGIDVILGRAEFVGRHHLEVDGRPVAFRAAVIATGSRPVVPDVLAPVEPLTTDTLWDRLADLPDRLIVVGGGPTGCELAQALARLGHEVTLVEAAHRLLPRLDRLAGDTVAARLSADGVRVLTGARVTAAARHGDEAAIDVDGRQRSLAGGAVIVAVGRRAVTDGLHLTRAGVRTRGDGAVLVDATLRTTTSNVYAAGDVTGGPRLTHVAAHHGAVAAGNGLFWLRRRVERRAVPRVVYTDPEIAHVGVTAGRARAAFPDASDVVALASDEVDRAITDRRTDGWVRLVTVRGRLVGATLAAPHAGESIAALADVVRRRGGLDDVAATLHPYPTYSIAAFQAAAYHRLRGLADDRVRAVTGRALGLLRALASVGSPSSG